jgi:mannan endo-1,4-beta-mannosidase
MIVLLSVILIAVIIINPGFLKNAFAAAPSQFVTVEGNKFMLAGEEFRFPGTNNYYFHYKPQAMVDDVIEDAARMGLKVIRIWGFMEGRRHDGNVMQPAPGIYDESGFRKLDYAIKKASEEGIKLVIVLTNNWDDFGGMNQYVRWVENAHEHDDFYTNEKIKELYKDYVSYMLNRTNTYTGLKYKDDPTIMTWELANEPRCQSDKTGDTLVEWVTEMSQYIKSIDERHLVAIGDEGFFNRASNTYGYGGYEGVDWDRLIRIPTIDYGTFHLYPDHWGWKDPLEDGIKWIKVHLETAKEVNKPVVLEEYGVRENRNLIYDLWNNAVYKNGGNGSMFWLLTGIDTGSGADAQGLYPNYDGLRVVEGSKTANLLADYAILFSEGKDVRKPGVYFITPVSDKEVNGESTVRVKVVSYKKKVTQVVFSSNQQTFKLNAKGNGYYEGTWDTTREPEGEVVEAVVEAFLEDGSRTGNKILVMVRNAEARYEVGLDFTFEDDLQGWWFAGTYEAEAGNPPVEHSGFNNGSLRANVKWLPDKGWSEFKLARRVRDMSDYIKVSFEIYIPVEGLDESGYLKPFFALNWEKVGLGEFDTKVADARRVIIDNKEYLKLLVSKEYDKRSDKNELEIGLVGSNLGYEGPVYVDNIQLIKKVYN